tara:strand:- start:2107 stop:3312 length:1206 start_codon:yes stop_codon:yes gene_type:complete
VNPTEIQETAIPDIIEGSDLLGIAPTGTGKTLAFLLPIFEKIMAEKLKGIRAIILAPTRELAEQIYQVALQLGKGTDVYSTVVYGGVNKKPQIKQLRRRPQIVIACPGRFLDHLRDRYVDLSKVQMLTLDEADTMCDMGFIDDIQKILPFIPKARQNLFFAATMQKQIRFLANTILNDPITVQIGKIQPVKTVSHSIYPLTEIMKKRMIIALLDATPTGKVIIFARTKHKARWLSKHLSKSKYRVAELHGNMTQNRRQQAIDGFKNGKHDFLVATDVAARGIDVAGISHVINFDMPNNADDYIHRIGRTGRAENVGEAISFYLKEDEFVLRQIETSLRKSIERKRLDDFDYEGFDPLKINPTKAKTPGFKNKESRYIRRNGPFRNKGTKQNKHRSYKHAVK